MFRPEDVGRPRAHGVVALQVRAHLARALILALGLDSASKMTGWPTWSRCCVLDAIAVLYAVTTVADDSWRANIDANRDSNQLHLPVRRMTGQKRGKLR